MNLNLEQQQIVDSTAKHRVVVAGPGSGKTRTLVAAIARAVRENDPACIMVMTYTNAAAAEIEERIKQECGDVRVGFCGTAHAFLLRLISAHAGLVRLPLMLSVIDDAQREAVVETIIREWNLTEKVSAKKVMKRLHDLNPTDNRHADVVAIEYNHRLIQSGLLDFDLILIKGSELVRRLGMMDLWSYTHLFVDEYQDVSDLDATIYNEMACEHKMFVGDSDQSVYGWRGSNCQHLVNMVDEATDRILDGSTNEEVAILKTNYRSGAAICAHANRLILGNMERVSKVMVPESTAPGIVAVRSFDNPALELHHVAMSASQVKGESVAILARTNWLANQFAVTLKSIGVPVAEKKYKALPQDWNRAKLFLSLAANPYNDYVAFQYLCEREGWETANQVKADASKNLTSINAEYLHIDPCAEPPSLNLEGLSSESRERIHDACRLMSGRGAWTIADLLVSLNARDEEYEVGKGICCTTFHSSKGREWDNVFMVGCEEGLIPNPKKDQSIEEARRLFFVAMTRARTKLVITHCTNRPESRGKDRAPGPMQVRQPSRFISESGL